MQYKPHQQRDHANGIARIRICGNLAKCTELFKPSLVGTYLSNRFERGRPYTRLIKQLLK